MIAETLKAFNKLKTQSTTAPMLVHYNLERQIILKIDVSAFAISEIISQLIQTSGQ